MRSLDAYFLAMTVHSSVDIRLPIEHPFLSTCHFMSTVRLTHAGACVRRVDPERAGVCARARVTQNGALVVRLMEAETLCIVLSLIHI